MGFLVDPDYAAVIVSRSVWVAFAMVMVQLAFCIKIITQKEEGYYGVATSRSRNE